MLDYSHGSGGEARLFVKISISKIFMTFMKPHGKIRSIQTSPGGIPKRDAGLGRLTKRGLDGDDWAHPKYHGGPNQALLLIGEEVLEELRGFGFEVFPGALGENLTTEGLNYGDLQTGMRLRLGDDAVIQLTKLREPCRTLDVYNRNPEAGRIQPILKERGRGGWYARVVAEGIVKAGDQIEGESQFE
jgi:MOSC domain-containing protein YiiM